MDFENRKSREALTNSYSLQGESSVKELLWRRGKDLTKKTARFVEVLRAFMRLGTRHQQKPSCRRREQLTPGESVAKSMQC